MGIALKHLSDAERIRIASQLFTVKEKDENKGELHGLCPIHGEKHPSFSYNYKKDIYSCFSCNASGDLLRLWTEVRNLGQKEGFKAFCEEHGISLMGGKQDDAGAEGGGGEPPPASYDLEEVFQTFPPLPEEWLARLEEKRGWSRRIMEILDLRLQTKYLDKKTGKIRQVRTPERIAIPVRDEKGKLVNLRLYKPGASIHKIISWGKSFGSSRLFPAKPFSDSDTILLCEGESDTICALSNGFNAITQTSKLKSWPDRHLAPFKSRDAIIAYDQDEPGQKYARYAAHSLQSAVKSVKVMSWPAFMGSGDTGQIPANHGQDLTDFFVRHKKTPKDLRELMDHSPSLGSEQPEVISMMTFFERGVNDRLSFKSRLLAEQMLKDMTLLSDPDTGLLYRWQGHIWEVYDEDHVRAIGIKYLENESQKSRVEDALYQVRSLSTIPHGCKTNDQADWICVKNGMLNLVNFETKPHAPEFYCTYSLPVEFNPESSARCDRWERFLAESVQTREAILQLQEFTGYILVRHTKFEKCLLLLGPGADGKSTFLKILKELVGNENCAAVSFQDLEDQFQRSSLYSKLLNISAEVGWKALESPYFKAIVSGDPINAAFKHKNTFTFSPYCKLAFAANRLPRVIDNSDGFFRRVLPIRFKRQFLEDADPNLFEDLRAELSEIFSWAIVGLHRLVTQGKFTECDETRELLMEYRRVNNPVLCFVQDQCAIGDHFETAKQTLYTEYRKYCGENGYQIMNRENFFRELYVAVNNLKQIRPRNSGSRERVISGIALSSDPPATGE